MGEIGNGLFNLGIAQFTRSKAIDGGLYRRGGNQIALKAVAARMQYLQGDFPLMLMHRGGNLSVPVTLCVVIQYGTVFGGHALGIR